MFNGAAGFYFYNNISNRDMYESIYTLDYDNISLHFIKISLNKII